jgi:ParB family chromosome partitioning protein
MTARKKGLGRGLDALLGGPKIDASNERLRTIPLHMLMPGEYQPRKDFDPVRLQELADSISAQGIVQPVVVREVAGERYEIIAGERRWRAAQMAGLAELPVIVRKVSDQSALAITLIENIQREDLNALEEAEALKRLLDNYALTHQQLADAVGKSRVTVSNLMRLNDLHPDVKPMLSSGLIEMGHARALLGLELEVQATVARKVAAKGMTVRATEALVQALREGRLPKTIVTESKDPDIMRLEADISARLGAAVSIKHGDKGAGQIVIKYSNLDELDGILEQFATRPDHC